MSSNKGSSQASRDSSNTYQSNDPGANQGRFDSNVEKAKKEVEKKLGLKDGKATNLTGKDQDFYGKEASAFAKEEAVKRGVGKVGNYFIQQGGEFIRIDKEQYDELKEKGATNLSFSLRGDKKTQEFMYGASSTAMGSGDPTGVLTSIPISEKMFERQKNIVSAIGLGLGLAGVPIMPSAMIFDAQRKSYDDYIQRFNNIQTSSTVLARNVASNNQVDASNNNRSTAVADQTAMSGDDEARIRNRSAYSGLTGAEQDARRFLDATGRNITGSMN
jgi:hypothetical protein